MELYMPPKLMPLTKRVCKVLSLNFHYHNLLCTYINVYSVNAVPIIVKKHIVCKYRLMNHHISEWESAGNWGLCSTCDVPSITTFICSLKYFKMCRFKIIKKIFFLHFALNFYAEFYWNILFKISHFSIHFYQIIIFYHLIIEEQKLFKHITTVTIWWNSVWVIILSNNIFLLKNTIY